MNIERGFRGKLDDYLSAASPFQVKITTQGSSVYDSCCFGVDCDNKLSDDRYMIFYNQPASPANEISFKSQGNVAEYTIDLAKLPSAINSLVFTVSIDGSGTMGQIQSQSVQIIQNGNTVLETTLKGSDFSSEKAVICMEIYLKSVWRISVVARGFNGGLADLLKNYGGELADEQSRAAVQNTAPKQEYNTTRPSSEPVPSSSSIPPAVPERNPNSGASQVSVQNSEEQLTNRVMSRINLSKDKINLEKHVINLSKCVIDLSKKSGIDLGNTRAKVVVALDYSGSMSSLYRNGTVQKTINRLVPLGLTFDDNGSIDIFLFQTDFRKMEDLDLSNYDGYINNVINRSGYTMGGTNYAPVLNAIIDGYHHSNGLFRGKSFIQPIVDNCVPTFILFITDGENSDRTSTDNIIRKSSEKNVFIQFIGIGNSSFSYLMALDDMTGRKCDNTGFSKMADLNSANDNELYTNVLEQFSKWLKGLQ